MSTAASGGAAPAGPAGGRVLWFDHLRLYAMAAVILMHTASGILNGPMGPGWHLDNILASLCFTAVPLFFMMSGSLLLSGNRTEDLTLLWRRRLPRLLVPLSFWSLVTVLWLWYRDGGTLRDTLLTLVHAFHTPAYVHLWFVYTLAALYVLSPLLYRLVRALDRKTETYLLGLMAAVVVFDLVRSLLPLSVRVHVGLDLFNKLRLLDGNLFAFLLGYYLSRREIRLRDGTLLGLAGLCWGVIVLGTWLESRYVGAYSATYQQQNGGWELVLAALLFLLARRKLDRPLRGRIAREAVRLSMPIYLMHGAVISVLWRLGLAPGRFLVQLADWALVCLVCFLLAKVLASVPGLRGLSTGLTPAEAAEVAFRLPKGLRSSGKSGEVK